MEDNYGKLFLFMTANMIGAKYHKKLKQIKTSNKNEEHYQQTFFWEQVPPFVVVFWLLMISNAKFVDLK